MGDVDEENFTGKLLTQSPSLNDLNSFLLPLAVLWGEVNLCLPPLAVIRCRSLLRSLRRSLGRLVGRSACLPACLPVGRSLCRSLFPPLTRQLFGWHREVIWGLDRKVPLTLHGGKPGNGVGVHDRALLYGCGPGCTGKSSGLSTSTLFSSEPALCISVKRRRLMRFRLSASARRFRFLELSN